MRFWKWQEVEGDWSCGDIAIELWDIDFLTHIQILCKYERVSLSNVSYKSEDIDHRPNNVNTLYIYRKMKRECKSHHLICTYINILPLWYCSAKWLHSNCSPDEITIEFALIWSVAEVNQVVLSLASILYTCTPSCTCICVF